MADRFTKRFIMSFAIGGQSIGLLFFAHIHESWEIVLFMLFMGAGYGTMLPLRAAIQAEYFGMVSFGSIQGMFSGIWTVGTILGPVIVGKFFDMTGDYRVIFTAYGIMTMISVPIMLAAKPPERGVDSPCG